MCYCKSCKDLNGTCVSFVLYDLLAKKGESTMKAFLEEYGIAIFVIACIMILVAMAEPVGSAIQTAVLDTISSFTQNTLTT